FPLDAAAGARWPPAEGGPGVAIEPLFLPFINNYKFLIIIYKGKKQGFDGHPRASFGGRPSSPGCFIEGKAFCLFLCFSHYN
ncbi:MAG: hypothetical protein ACT6RN_27395, partial [Agrobacterium sp.]|uniref:hypothetical protein n=1 Tax=Agrobacterium sp. TaxID=361 RepID=UPI004037EC86